MMQSLGPGSVTSQCGKSSLDRLQEVAKPAELD